MADTIIGSYESKPQQRKPRPDCFTTAKQQLFFDALALTCNVDKAAEYAGVHRVTVYKHRRKRPDFAERWREALALGYDRLEAMALEHVGAGLEAADPDRAAEAGPESGAPIPFDFERALTLLRLHRAIRDAKPSPARGGPPMRNATREETNAALLKAIAVARRSMGDAADG